MCTQNHKYIESSFGCIGFKVKFLTIFQLIFKTSQKHLKTFMKHRKRNWKIISTLHQCILDKHTLMMVNNFTQPLTFDPSPQHREKKT